MKVSGEEDRSLCSLNPVEIRGSLPVDFAQCKICQESCCKFYFHFFLRQSGQALQALLL